MHQQGTHSWFYAMHIE